MSALDILLNGYKLIQSAGLALQPRPVLNFIGATVVDNPANGSTDVTAGSGGAGPNTAPPDPSTLTWVQQLGLVSGTSSFTTDNGGFTLIAPAPGDNAKAIHALVTAAPVAPWTFTIGFIPDGLCTASDYRLGLVLRELATGKMLVLNLSDQATGTAVSSWTNATTNVSEDYLASALGGAAIDTSQNVNSNQPNPGPIYLRVHNDGTSLFFYRSLSGSSFTTHSPSAGDGFSPVPVAINNFFSVGPTQIGVGLNNVYQISPAIAMRVISWSVGP